MLTFPLFSFYSYNTEKIKYEVNVAKKVERKQIETKNKY